MSSLGTSKGILEIAKFGVYVSVPVALTYLVATDSKTLKKLMGLMLRYVSLRSSMSISRTRTYPLAIFSLPVYVLIYSGSYRFTSRFKLPVYVPPLQRPYVVYPPEGPRPPPPEELRERAREIARKRQQS
ncbi:hypothetical protein ZEAMMB73_Zm00001d007822 [Zea mays]|uniref:Uncharacterized protein n=1 Tax=Zea mays TaxID=4577 RepID=A0A1D6F947_MAIZE|nr:hypothetical protein ZEAMMB73_Zm00001d007822 [Zea mays]